MFKTPYFLSILEESGISKATSEEDKQKIKYLNQGIVYGTLLFLPNLVFEAIIGFAPATILNFIFIFCAAICFFINRQGRYNFAKNFALIGLDLILLTACISEGTRTGNYLIYAALILLFPILVKVKDSKRDTMAIFIFTVACFIASIAFCPQVGYFDGLSNDDAALMFKASFMVSFGLTTILAFIIFIITQTREAELINAKELAEENAKIKLQFISNMSHELRTPLNGIIGTTNLLQLDEHTAQQKEQYELLNYSSQHMLHLVNDVLDFSKIESGKIELEKRNFNLQTFVKNIYNSFANQFEQKKLYFKLENNDENLNYNILGDDMRLGQILNNLLSNALKFTHKGGVNFCISTSVVDKKIQITFQVTDTGIGIRSDSFGQIFESFVQADLNTTRKYGGTGLGLTISKKLVDVFGTSLMVNSEIGKGSQFYFSPIFDLVENYVEEEITEKDIKALTGLKVLLAEDNKINMLIAKKFLLKWGVVVTEAKNGKEAIEKFATQHFDLLLLDLEMPEVDGFTALAEIRKINPTVPAIAFTAAVFENIQATLLAKGFNDYVMKPFAPEDLNIKLYEQMNNLILS
jgi:signal transduction histidine kinase